VSEQALYLSEGEIARRILGKAHAEAWPDIVRVLERDRGFPPINSVIGMRYWPGVVKWFEQYEKVDSLSPGRHSVSQDGDAGPPAQSQQRRHKSSRLGRALRPQKARIQTKLREARSPDD
jgi:hypothetical protein